MELEVRERRGPLSATFVKAVQATVKTKNYGDGRGGHGLTLMVKQGKGSRVVKCWTQRLRIDGKAFNMGLGSYPLVTLAEARGKALENARAVAAGQDPRRPTTSSSTPTFRDAAEKVIALHAANWKEATKTADLWRARLDTYAMRRLGERRVDLITTADVMAVLTPIWITKGATSKKVRQHLGTIFKWAVAQGYRDDNPAGDAISAALPKSGNDEEHHRALPHGAVAGALEIIRASGAQESTKLALEFTVLTAARSGEVRGGRWSEIDTDAALWTVPASRMKGNREHRVPLSTSALAVLQRAREYQDDSGLIFPSKRGKELSDNTLSKLLRENQVDGVVHGFRASFKSWAGDTGVNREIAEAALAHTLGNAVEQAYNRTDLLARRRDVMEAWGAYLAN